MFDLKKFTALAMAGTFAFGVAATTTYAAEAPQQELPKAEQPAPQLHNDQKDKQDMLGQEDDVIQIDQMGEFEGKDQQDKKNQPADELDRNKPVEIVPAPEQKSKDVKDVKDIQDVKDIKDVKNAPEHQLPEAKEPAPQPEHK